MDTATIGAPLASAPHICAPAIASAIAPHEDAVIQAAMAILKARMTVPGCALSSPHVVRDFLLLQMAGLDREVFGVVFLNAQHQVIAFEVMFQGTLTQTSVYPREVLRAALKHNAAAVILAHNHPSGVITPSRADELLTQTLKSALAMVDVRVLDHMVCGHGSAYSFAEHGLLK
ncbi:DNA repair protein RadC [Aquabacterium sp.]|uniref:RadC family protein n=1 Tax=Aquabacterium TaxID=92793 RepID=UPI001DCE06F2|nr:DNA repair protein RadC [Aquabacterium sp.]MBT9608754.1 DNA repair protein RadC [Aquabacterium sp.]|tara:strand:+ start:271 stop:792 length:522 start_codon:yes stop_codon:yes gene_type:complete